MSTCTGPVISRYRLFVAVDSRGLMWVTPYLDCLDEFSPLISPFTSVRLNGVVICEKHWLEMEFEQWRVLSTWNPHMNRPSLKSSSIVKLRYIRYTRLLTFCMEATMRNCPRYTSTDKVKSGVNKESLPLWNALEHLTFWIGPNPKHGYQHGRFTAAKPCAGQIIFGRDEGSFLPGAPLCLNK